MNGDWVGRAAIGAGVAFVIIGAGAAALMNDDDGATVEIRSEVRVERAEAPESPAPPEAPSAAEAFSLSELPRRIEEALTEGIEAELAASIEAGDFDIRIDGERISADEWNGLDAQEREARLAGLRAKVADLEAEATEARAEGNEARASILDGVAGSIQRLVDRLEG